MRKPSLKSLKAKAWKYFSEWVRRRYADKRGFVICVSCGAKTHWTTANSGHFLHGHSKPTFLDIRNVHVQCIRCNLYLSGNLVEYAAFMKNKYGWETIDALRELSHQVVKMDRSYYESIIEEYKGKLEGLNDR